MKKLMLIAAVILLAASFVIQSRSSAAAAEKEAVRQAALDYLEALYEVAPARIARSVHPNLTKRGYYLKKGENTYSEATMTYQQLYDLAGKWNEKHWVPKDAPKEVIVFDVSDQTASAKVVAQWGIDYLHLAKYNGKWQIVNVLWQSPPKATE